MIETLSLDLLRPLFPPVQGIRLLGVTLSNLEDVASATPRQMALTLEPNLLSDTAL